MSEVNATDFKEIHSIEDLLNLYEGVGADSKSGIEVEFPFFNPQEPDLSAMSLSQNKVLKNSAMNALAGDWLHNEPTSDLLEVASIAMPLLSVALPCCPVQLYLACSRYSR